MDDFVALDGSIVTDALLEEMVERVLEAIEATQEKPRRMTGEAGDRTTSLKEIDLK